jgi:hypothetical protein
MILELCDKDDELERLGLWLNREALAAALRTKDAEISALKHDIQCHIAIASEQADKTARLQQEALIAKGLIRGLCADREKAESEHDAVCDANDRLKALLYETRAILRQVAEALK